MSEGGEEVKAEEAGPAIKDDFKGVAIVDGHRARVAHDGKLSRILDTAGTYLYLEDPEKLVKIYRPNREVTQYEAVDGKSGAKVLLTTGDLRSGEIVKGKPFKYGADQKHSTGPIKRIYIVEADKGFPGQIKTGPIIDVGFKGVAA